MMTATCQTQRLVERCATKDLLNSRLSTLFYAVTISIQTHLAGLSSVMPSLVSIAEELLAQAKKIDALLEKSGTPYPSFDHDTLETLPDDAQKLRRELADTSHTIRQLARGARLSGLDIAFSVSL